MAITRGIKLNQINKSDVSKVDYSGKDNLIILKKGDPEWYFVYDNDGKKIPKKTLEKLSEEKLFNFSKSHIAQEAAGNDDILSYLLGGARGK